jgi:hypothetical protein
MTSKIRASLEPVSEKDVLFHKVVIPAKADCVCRTANANAEGGPEGERHGWREFIQCLCF